MMVNFIVSAKVGVIFLNAVITVRTNGYNLFHAIAVHYFDIGLCLRLEQIIVTAAHSRIAAAAFFISQNTEAYSGRLQNLGKGNGYFFAAVIKRTGASYIEKIFHVGIFSQSFHAK